MPVIHRRQALHKQYNKQYSGYDIHNLRQPVPEEIKSKYTQKNTNQHISLLIFDTVLMPMPQRFLGILLFGI